MSRHPTSARTGVAEKLCTSCVEHEAIVAGIFENNKELVCYIKRGVTDSENALVRLKQQNTPYEYYHNPKMEAAFRTQGSVPADAAVPFVFYAGKYRGGVEVLANYMFIHKHQDGHDLL
jgi:hypothetical protein